MPTLPQPPQTEADFRRDLAAARGSDREALNRLAALYYPRVQQLVHARLAQDFRSSRPWLSSRFSTQDIVQDAFSGIERHLEAFRGTTPDSFIAYLAMVVRNLVLGTVRYHERARRDARRVAPGSAEWQQLGTDEEPEGIVARAEQDERVQRHLAELEPGEVMLFRARSEGTHSFRDLAEMLGYGSESAARRAYYRIQARLLLGLSTSDEGGGA